MDTIVAPATGPAHGAIAIIRISGPQALPIAGSLIHLHNSTTSATLLPRHAHYALLYDGQKPLDEAVITYFPGPHSYTGEDIVEIATHGAPYIVQRTIEILIAQGARPANPGEYTQRAFLAGKMDLAQAEAVGDLVAATTKTQHAAAMGQLRGNVSKAITALREQLLQLATLIELEIDFGEEDVEFADRAQLRELATNALQHIRTLADTFSLNDAIKNGVPIAIAGPPNAGKSTLLNTLLDEDRAIVTPYAGTTRDLLEGQRTIGGVLFRFTDTAGLRQTDDPVETIGVQRATNLLRESPAVLFMLDASTPTLEQAHHLDSLHTLIPAEAQCLILLSKADTMDSQTLQTRIDALRTQHPEQQYIGWGAPAKQGLLAVLQWLATQAKRLLPPEGGVVITNQRHYAALRAAQQQLTELLDALDQGLSPDLLAYHLRAVTGHLASITGEIGVEEILGNIFKNFCIGK